MPIFSVVMGISEIRFIFAFMYVYERIENEN